jgi:hypothetical protein
MVKSKTSNSKNDKNVLIKRTIKYHVFELSADGLLKRPKKNYGYGDYGGAFDEWGYDSKAKAWEAIEKHLLESYDPSKTFTNKEESFFVLPRWVAKVSEDTK